VGKIYRRTVAAKTKFHVTRTVRVCKVSITGGQKGFTNLQFIIFHSEVESLFDWTMPDNVFSNYFHRITLPTTVIYLLSLDLLQLYHLKAIRSIAETLSISSHIINKFLLSQTSQRQQVQIEKIVSMYRTHPPTQTKF
jgi:hypothetical protein